MKMVILTLLVAVHNIPEQAHPITEYRDELSNGLRNVALNFLGPVYGV